MTHSNIVLSVLAEYGPLSDYGIYHFARGRGQKMSPSSARTRRRELLDAGVIRDSGLREQTPSGRAATVWTLSA